MKLQNFKNWISGFGTIFSILGFFATLYIGIWYVPSWIQESQNVRRENAEMELIQSVKELVYNDTTCNLNELSALIKAKELTLKEDFYLSNSDILTKVEESFMQDKFLPLLKRKELISKIETIKQNLKVEPKDPETISKAESKKNSWTILISIIGTLLASLLGIISSYFKFKTEKDKDEEIQNELHKVSIEPNLEEFAYEFEKNIAEILRKRNDIQIEEQAKYDRGIDIVFNKGEKKYFIEAKFLRKSKVGLKTIHQLENYLSDKTGEGWLVYNTDLTNMVEQQIEEFNSKNKHIKIKPIHVKDSKEFELKLNELVK